MIKFFIADVVRVICGSNLSYIRAEESEKRSKTFRSFICLLSCALMLNTTSPVHASEVSSTQQIQCIARAIYGEASTQSKKGKIAIGVVIRDRAEDPSGVWPATYCGVVYQRNQFYGAARAYAGNAEIYEIAREIASGEHSFKEIGLPSCVRYFATSRQSFMREVGSIGAHVFGCPNS